VDAVLESVSRVIWNLPASFPKAGLHTLLDEVGLNIPSVWEDYCGATVRSWTQILNYEGALGVTARASIQRASDKFRQWPIEMAFQTQRAYAGMQLRFGPQHGHSALGGPPPHRRPGNLVRKPNLHIYHNSSPSNWI